MSCNPFFDSDTVGRKSIESHPSLAYLNQSSIGLVDSSLHLSREASQHPSTSSDAGSSSQGLSSSSSSSSFSSVLASIQDSSPTSRSKIFSASSSQPPLSRQSAPSSSSSAACPTFRPPYPTYAAQHPSTDSLTERPVSYPSLPQLRQHRPSNIFPNYRQTGMSNFFQNPLVPSSENWNVNPENPGLDVTITNVVAVCSVRCHLDLHVVTMKCVNTEYRRDRAVVFMKLRSPYVTFKIWNSGKITCTGAVSIEDAKKGCRRVARLLWKIGFKVRFSGFRVVNILATSVLPFAVKLLKFAEKNRKDVEFEPEIYPGAILRYKDLKASLRIYSTGSVTVTAPKISSIIESILFAYQRVFAFRDEELDKNVTPPGTFRHSHYMSIVPLVSQCSPSFFKIVPKGPYHSKYKQKLHRERIFSQAINRVRAEELADKGLFSLDDLYDSESDFSDDE